MILILSFASILVSLAYYATNGKIDGRMFYFKFTTKNYVATGKVLFDKDEHPAFVIQRSPYFIMLYISHLHFYSWLESLVIVTLHALMYPFIQEGFMCMQRNDYQLKVYPKRFFDDSKDSKAKADSKFSPFAYLVGRFLFFAFSLFGLMAIILIHENK